jgi:hypothetical protein
MFWQRTVKESLEYAESTINNVREPLIALNKNLNVISVSRSFTFLYVDGLLAAKPRGCRDYPVRREKLCEV